MLGFITTAAVLLVAAMAHADPPPLLAPHGNTTVQAVSVSQRQLQNNPAFIAQNGLLVMEAESVPTAAPWVRETKVNRHTGSSYLRFNGNQDNGGPANGRNRFFFTIDKPGDYRLILRTLKTNDERKDFAKYVAVSVKGATIHYSRHLIALPQ